jgi:hypothetical protein
MELKQFLDAEEFADSAMTLWRDASASMSTAPLELFVKAALRVRVTRDTVERDALVDRTLESGLAVRALPADQKTAGFAAAAGISRDALRWAVDRACTYRARATAFVPGPEYSLPELRWDLDAPSSLPTEATLRSALSERPKIQWVEAGTTVEVVVGVDGWRAVRMRHRFWALAELPDAQLLAQRGFHGWESLLEAGVEDGLHASAILEGTASQSTLLRPQAAGTLVAALVAAFHGPESPDWETCGAGWDLSDEPLHPNGLSGGSFDDAGFPAVTRALGRNGHWVGNLDGPGTIRRTSFREPPAESPTNLVIPGKAQDGDRSYFEVASNCRVLRTSPNLWVLELTLSGREHNRYRFVRVPPKRLLDACVSGVGANVVTAGGAIVPALVFEDLPVD